MSDSLAVTRLLNGCVDLHCHSGPNPFPRRFDHVEAAKDAERLGMRGVLVKSHHHNTVMDLLAMTDQLAGSSTPVFGGIALNSQVGGINPGAVAMCLRMGGRAVWFPTFSSGRHIDCHPEGSGFPTATVEVPSSRVDIHQENGELVPEVFEVLDLIEESNAMLSGGHMEAASIKQLFTEAEAKGISKMVINHPNFVIGAEPDQCRELVALGAYVEHEAGMYDPEGSKKWDPALLLDWIEQIGPERTVIASDLGQDGRPMPVDAFIRVATALLDLGLDEKSLRQVFCDNPAFLLGLDD
ncbi:hypothetical protein FB381_3330 [Nocardioides albertanoniae]|uniref:Uncharacterized protein n=1 Tax=Nocardioides albertanoniae TaxID=1175486 RepID=A0A543AA25_9ACTN|nr:DUF6282 family protein [Nocardioides albertanoniae]TQL69425.1 hypothetical protein FB381_3330 [Nocardioides albertanoniae]